MMMMRGGDLKGVRRGFRGVGGSGVQGAILRH